jgi:EmrB/QacA subfamily drug resistance transporter
MEQTLSAPDTPLSLRASVSQKRLAFVLVGVVLGMLLSALDGTIVGTAMPTIIADLGGLAHYSWVFTAYLLASTVTVPIYGKLSDIYGRRIFFVGGMVLFLIGSALSGLSRDMTQLIVFRGIQGIGAGALMPIAMAIIGDLFPPAQRAKWQGALTAIFGLATIVGPTLGGLITDNWGWPWVFYVNMPLGVVAILTTLLAMPGQSKRRAHTIDYAGTATMVAGTVPLLLAFSFAGSEYAWGSAQIIGLLIVAVVMLSIFSFIETRASEPIISPALFKNRVFTVSMIATFLTSVGMYGAISYLPLFVQGVMGNSATNAGAVLTPMMIGFIISSIIGGQILGHTGHYKALALGGFIVGAFGMFLFSRMGVATTNGTLVRNMLVTGLGIGISMSLFTIVVQNAFPARQLGEVTAGLTFFRSIGGTIGVALLGSVMTNRFQSAFGTNLPEELRQRLPADQLTALRNPQVLLSPAATARIHETFAAFGQQSDTLFNQFMLAIRQSLSAAVTTLFAAAMLAMILAFIACLFLREIPLRKSNADHATSVTAEAIASADAWITPPDPQVAATAAEPIEAVRR